MAAFIYILASKSNVLYVGVTSNLSKRIWEHKNKVIQGFTAKYKINRLIYYEEFSSIEEAIAAEKRIKGWTRKKKIELVKAFNPEFKDLSESNICK